ncbi:hypothetical protein [Neodiprion sertifer nucleopolyhedrovirus]|uniref:Uncharacterized protein n=1 Tax=Neodiprion sertifer nucleopolyhedrovirus TaxID=111874 RepID=Q6JKF2_9CBAC|nr:hypothetical protein NeseNPV_gp08 [Neodiprion sertifer nucleopolyhedrovirus]AAQ96385.1 hypothetical protein [Neodiprion sertifer nucleopolyhedrovirus]
MKASFTVNGLTIQNDDNKNCYNETFFKNQKPIEVSFDYEDGFGANKLCVFVMDVEDNRQYILAECSERNKITTLKIPNCFYVSEICVCMQGDKFKFKPVFQEINRYYHMDKEFCDYRKDIQKSIFKTKILTPNDLMTHVKAFTRCIEKKFMYFDNIDYEDIGFDVDDMLLKFNKEFSSDKFQPYVDLTNEYYGQFEISSLCG